MVKHIQTILWQQPTNCLSVFDHFVKLALEGLRQKVYICIYAYTDINKICKSKKTCQLLLWIWIKKTKWVNEGCDKESYHYWIFSIGPDNFFTKHKYSWISHANLAVWWWRSSKISSSNVVDLCFFFACHINDSVLNNNYIPLNSSLLL